MYQKKRKDSTKDKQTSGEKTENEQPKGKTICKQILKCIGIIE